MRALVTCHELTSSRQGRSKAHPRLRPTELPSNLVRLGALPNRSVRESLQSMETLRSRVRGMSRTNRMRRRPEVERLEDLGSLRSRSLLCSGSL